MRSRHNIQGLENLLTILEQGHDALVDASKEVRDMSYSDPRDAIWYGFHQDLTSIVRSIDHIQFMLNKIKVEAEDPFYIIEK